MWCLGLLWSNGAPPASVAGQAESRSLGRGRWRRNPSALLQKTVTIHTTALLRLSPETGREELETENRDSQAAVRQWRHWQGVSLVESSECEPRPLLWGLHGHHFLLVLQSAWEPRAGWHTSCSETSLPTTQVPWDLWQTQTRPSMSPWRWHCPRSSIWCVAIQPWSVLERLEEEGMGKGWGMRNLPSDSVVKTPSFHCSRAWILSRLEN